MSQPGRVTTAVLKVIRDQDITLRDQQKQIKHLRKKVKRLQSQVEQERQHRTACEIELSYAVDDLKECAEELEKRPKPRAYAKSKQH
jgi:chromosome segregation ATPase